MEKNFFGDRRKGFEAEFFRRQEAALLQRLRDEEARRSARQALAAASHITDEVLLDQLAALGIKPETVVALSLVPLVEIAWADGTVQASERQAILEAARAAELVQGGQRRPTAAGVPLGAAARASPNTLAPVHQSLAPRVIRQGTWVLKADLLERARRVAEAAGGFMGMGPKVSSKEAALLADFARALNA